MMFSPVRAILRQYAIGHFVMTLFILLPFLWLMGVFDRPMSTFAWSLLVGAQIPWLLMLIDILVVFYYVRKMQSTVSMSAAQEAFTHGATWKFLREHSGKVKELAKADARWAADLKTVADRFPELRDDRAWAAALSRRDYLAASVIADRMEQARAKAAQRQELASREIETVVAEGVSMGVSEAVMRRAVGEGIPQARALITKQAKNNRLLREARKLGCEDLIRTRIDAGSDGDPELALSLAGKYLKRAADCDAVAEVGEYLRLGSLDGALQAIVAAETRRDRSVLEESLKRRIYEQERSARKHLFDRLEALGTLEYGSREFRKALYDLKKELGMT
jgi:hypothetical protein